MNLEARIKEERERLGHSQTAFAALAGASKHSQINWEKGVGTPTAAVLAAWAVHGLDVLYVVTGQRAGGTAAPAPAATPAVSAGDRTLLANFHAAPAQVQAGIKTTLGAFAPAGVGAQRNKAA